jgi:hypothetical protein
MSKSKWWKDGAFDGHPDPAGASPRPEDSSKLHVLRPKQEPLHLADVLAYAEQRQLTLRLDIFLGAIEVGRIDILCGVVLHAEIPGAEGDGALELLAAMPHAELRLRSVSAEELRRRTVRKSWWDHFDPKTRPPNLLQPILEAHLANGDPLPVGQRAWTEDPASSFGTDSTAKALGPEPSSELKTPIESVPEEDAPSFPGLEGEQYEELFRKATQAYMTRAYDKALELLRTCAALRPSDERIKHNIAKIQNRTRGSGGEP